MVHSFKAVFLVLLLCFFCFIENSYSQEGFPYCETLTNGVNPRNTEFGGDAKFVMDARGNGVFRLTSNTKEQNGYLYVDIPFPSIYGIKVSFEFFSYGGEGGGDGLSFFMFDAAVPSFQPGGFGGALGYANEGNNETPGLKGAYIGIGLDEYGNFSNAIEGKDGPGFQPNAVVVRGPGNGYEGYNYVAGIGTDLAGGEFSAEDQFPLSSGGVNTSRVVDPNKAGYRKVFIELQPAKEGIGYKLDVEMLVTTVENEPRMVSVFEGLPYNYEAPDNLKVGFAASTGAASNFHEIRNIVVEVSDQENLKSPEVKSISEVICKGKTEVFEIIAEDVWLPNTHSTISCLQIYKTLEEIQDVEELDPCSIKVCNPTNQQLELEGGFITTGGTGGDITFETDPNIAVNELIFYYTVTDNYGKTSAPASFTVQLHEFQDAPVIFDEREFEKDDWVPATSFRLCEEDKVSLKVLAEGEGTYQWFRDGVEIPGEVADVLNISSGGTYTVWMINETSCSIMSQEVEVIYPGSVAVKIPETVTSCGEDLLDLRRFIDGYNDALFDYEVTGPNEIVYVNEKISTIDLSGEYKVRSKHKDLACWSDFYHTQVNMVEDPVEADFNIAVVFENGEEEMTEIFLNDQIQFKDLSLNNPYSWEWDFGDGNTAKEQNPRHSYAAEGSYMVALTVFDEQGYCFSSKRKTLNVRSYRIMYPTAFTPLMYENQFFKPKFKGVKELKLYIFNSWGDLIYTSVDISDNGWDGTKEGILQPNGNYIFKVEFITVRGERVTDSGKFTLIR